MGRCPSPTNLCSGSRNRLRHNLPCAGSKLNTSGQGHVIHSVDMSNPAEALADEVSGIGSASAFGGAPADGE